jgi:uncharacterized protein YpmS
MISKNKGYGFIGFFLLIITLTSLACNLPMAIRGYDNIEVSEEAAFSFEGNMQDTVEELKETGQLELTISESELTSYIQTKLNQDPNSVVRNTQIYLRDGKIQLTGDVKQGNLTLPMKASLNVQADGSGGIDYEVDSASVGPLKLPSNILNEITDQVQVFVGSSISGQIPNLYIDSITISDGFINIFGRSR